ncbi:caspase, EACC1-associated type [Nocardia asteroides]|uniref:caspase, EACC1-associated type n=1 Tax=Nocardia asteroides TaxID=1824 RepID=UPI001E5A312A|nr:caspase family protein [Nocardia asteroides]UGT55002.1 caspase family protein [Nocardia asteroides]
MIVPSSSPGSRAILIGTASYTHPDLAAIPAALNNLTDLQKVLTSDGGGFAPEHCTLVPDPLSGTQVGEALAEAAGEATDVLFVYYTGHGVLDSRGRLYLTVTGTSPTRPAWTSVPFQTLREEILESRATARILILDCCYSGRAFEAMSDTASVIAGETSIRGTYTITSSAANETSFAPRGHRNTAFTAALLTAADTADFTLDELYSHVEQHLADRGHPRPRRRAVDTAGELKLLSGRRANPPRKATDTGSPGDAVDLDELMNLLRGPDAETRCRKAADTGNTRAMIELGDLLKQRGELVGAETWYRRAADDGNSDAMVHLGDLLKNRGDLVDAETLYRKAADIGNTRAMIRLGDMLENRLEKRICDLADAETWYRLAAGKGNTNAMIRLGDLLRKRSDVVDAENWYQKAADNGNANATVRLGYLRKK